MLVAGSEAERKNKIKIKITLKMTVLNPSPVHPNTSCRALPLFSIYMTNKLSGCISRKRHGKDNLEISKYSLNVPLPHPREGSTGPGGG